MGHSWAIHMSDLSLMQTWTLEQTYTALTPPGAVSDRSVPVGPITDESSIFAALVADHPRPDFRQTQPTYGRPVSRGRQQPHQPPQARRGDFCYRCGKRGHYRRDRVCKVMDVEAYTQA
jgi:hypothetical protein